MKYSEIIANIRQSIQENWGEIEKWNSIDENSFNCYQFAIGSFVITDIYVSEKLQVNMLKDEYDEEITFGFLGSISKSRFKHKKLTKAILDLETLGLTPKIVSKNTCIKENCIRIAYFNTRDDFHFARRDSKTGKWYQKNGWDGEISQVLLKHITKIENVNPIFIDISKPQ